MRLILLQIKGVGVSQHAVAVPFEIGQVGILAQKLVHDAEHEVLYLRIAQIERHLVTVIIGLAVRIVNYPVGMFLIQFAFRIDHLGFDPDTEFYSGAVGSTHQSADAIRQFGGGRLPIAKPRLVAAAGIFITEPTVIEQEHIYPKMFGLFH